MADSSPIRICHVIESCGGGSSQVVVDLLRHGVAAGDQLTLIYSPTRAEPLFAKAVEALRGKVRVHPLPMQRRVGLGDIGAAWRLLRLLQRLGPFQIIHSHSSKAGALARLAGMVLPDAAQVYTPHAFVTMAPSAPAAYSVIEWLASWFCDALIVGSNQEFNHAREHLRISASRLRLIPMGVDLTYRADRGEARKIMSARASDYLVGFVGRLVEQKNPMRFAEVLSGVALLRPDMRFVVVGDGPLREDFERELERRRLSGRVLLLAGHNARDLMPGFDCLVCTSDYESFGLIFPEAMAAGVPLVTPPVGIARSAVLEGQTGFLTSFEPRDISNALLKLAALDEAARAEMSAKCQIHARQFDFEDTARRTRALYHSLLSRSSRYKGDILRPE